MMSKTGKMNKNQRKKQPFIRDPYLLVGTISRSIAKLAGIKPADIYISKNYRVHLTNRHPTEYEQVGLDTINYVTFICNNFNEIRATGKIEDEVKEAVLLIVRHEKLHDVAVIELNYSQEHKFWEIKTAEPRRNSAVKKLALKWEGAKHSSGSNGNRLN